MNKFNELYESLTSQLTEATKKVVKVYDKVALDSESRTGKSDTKYYAYIADDPKYGLTIAFTPNPKDPLKGSTGGWGLQGFLYGDEHAKAVEDKVYVDFGQRWIISGFDKILPQIKKDYPQGK